MRIVGRTIDAKNKKVVPAARVALYLNRDKIADNIISDASGGIDVEVGHCAGTLEWKVVAKGYEPVELTTK